jgi:hypothetical protein
MVSTPSYLVYLDNEATLTRDLSPPTGPPAFSGTQIDEISGSWAGVEAGLTRLGIAHLGSWGWIEADLIVAFPLQTPELGIDRKGTANVRVGGVFTLTERFKLGAGFFTDFSPEAQLTGFSDSELDFYGFTLGLDFANRAAPPQRDDDGFYLAFAVALRYAHGSGSLAGFLLPSTFPDPPSQPGQLNIVDITVNEFGINLAVKAAF